LHVLSSCYCCYCTRLLDFSHRFGSVLMKKYVCMHVFHLRLHNIDGQPPDPAVPECDDSHRLLHLVTQICQLSEILRPETHPAVLIQHSVSSRRGREPMSPSTRYSCPLPVSISSFPASFMFDGSAEVAQCVADMLLTALLGGA
jgi:hypothetical protein